MMYQIKIIESILEQSLPKWLESHSQVPSDLHLLELPKGPPKALHVSEGLQYSNEKRTHLFQVTCCIK